MFADPRRLGARHVRALVPVGYAGGVHVRVGRDVAASGLDGRVRPDTLARRLGAG